MIKANELRIGNLLLNAGGVVVSTTTQTISDVELKLNTTPCNNAQP